MALLSRIIATMPEREEYKDRFTIELAKCGPIKTKPMFGGIGIYYKEHFFAVIDDDSLYFKVDDTNVGDFEKHNMPFWIYSPSGYCELPESILMNESKLQLWVDASVAIVANKKFNKIQKKKDQRDRRRLATSKPA